MVKRKIDKRQSCVKLKKKKYFKSQLKRKSTKMEEIDGNISQFNCD